MENDDIRLPLSDFHSKFRKRRHTKNVYFHGLFFGLGENRVILDGTGSVTASLCDLGKGRDKKEAVQRLGLALLRSDIWVTVHY